VGLERGPLSLVSTIEELLGREHRIRPWGCVTLTTRHSLSSKFVANFADKRRSLGRYILPVHGPMSLVSKGPKCHCRLFCLLKVVNADYEAMAGNGSIFVQCCLGIIHQIVLCSFQPRYSTYCQSQSHFRPDSHSISQYVSGRTTETCSS
jgi:hypothetical protein